MNYEIVELYTEQLNISSFKNSFQEENIESLVNVNTSIIVPKQGDLYTFVIEFKLRAINNPIFLNWRGIGIVAYDGPNKLTEDMLLNDKDIIVFVTESIDKISFLLGGKLPNIVDELKRKK